MAVREWLDGTFAVSANGSTVKTEVLSGIATFFTAGFILTVNPQLLNDGLGNFNPNSTRHASLVLKLVLCSSRQYGSLTSIPASSRARSATTYSLAVVSHPSDLDRTPVMKSH